MNREIYNIGSGRANSLILLELYVLIAELLAISPLL
jgi:hypothetical protein